MEIEEEEDDTLTLDEVNKIMTNDIALLEKHFNLVVEKELQEPAICKNQKTFDKYNIELPIGQLFYPCCGDDIDEPLSEFFDYISQFCFADPYNPPGLKRENFEKIRSKRNYKQVAIGNIINVARSYGSITSGLYNDKRVSVYSNDGLITLLEEIKNLSVFFYRGDSPGEGGSNQWWLAPTLFHLVLNRLYDGGLIVTDGSNCGYKDRHFGGEVPWNPICNNEDKRTYFEYGNRIFKLVGEMQSLRTSPKIWQVTRIIS